MTTTERLNPEKVSTYIDKICEDKGIRCYRGTIKTKELLRKNIYNLTNKLLDLDTIDEINLNHIHIMYKLYFYAIIIADPSMTFKSICKYVPFTDIDCLKELFIKHIYALTTSSGDNSDLKKIKSIRNAHSVIRYFINKLNLSPGDTFTQEIKHFESMDNDFSNPTYIPEYLSLDIKPVMEEY